MRGEGLQCGRVRDLAWMARVAMVVVVLLGGGLSTHAGEPSVDERRRLAEGIEILERGLEGLPEQRDAKNDAAICLKALSWMVRYEEWARKTAVRDALAVAKTGEERVKRIQAGEPAVALKPGKHVVAYRSAVDESLQPYAVSLPEGWRASEARRWPLHVVLHGRTKDLNEVAFFGMHDGKPPVKGSNWIQIDVYGRGNNAYRWAGETDVFEAMADVKKRFRIDERRITLWGFSMGGAGAWHLGLQHPDLWSSVGAGAGFVDFYEYQKVTEKLPDVQDKMLRIYDSKLYATNLFDVPFISYGGELDPQLATTIKMQDAAREVGAPLSVIIGHKMGHKFDDVSLKTFMAYHAAHTEQGRPEFPGRRELKFVTYTLKFNRCDWLRIEEQEIPYERSEVASTFKDDVLNVTTENVRALAIARGAGDAVVIDGGAKVMLADAAGGDLPDVYFVLEPTGWKVLNYDESIAFADNTETHKRKGLQGPIDDAFAQPFVVVSGTGKAWNPDVDAWAKGVQEQKFEDWDYWFRGKSPTVADTAVTDEMIASRNLVLYGDPGSNAVLAKIVEQLPLTWTKDTLRIGGVDYPAATHAPALIFPNPLNPRRYVVLNSGPTVDGEEYKKSNAWFFPRLGDAAVVQVQQTASSVTGQPVWSTIMNSDWEIEE